MESIYRQLQRKINMIGVGLPESSQGLDEVYLKGLFTPEEAEFALKMDLRLQTAEETAESMGIPVEEAQRMLDLMCKDGLVYRRRINGLFHYYLVGTYHGFFEWNVGRMDPSWVKPMVKHNVAGLTNVFWTSERPLFRYLPIRPELVENNECLDIDNVDEIIKRQKKIATVPCFCRSSADMFTGKENFCKHDSSEGHHTCMAFGEFVDFYEDVLHVGRRITNEEALDLIHKCSETGTASMVFNDKVVEGMCSCCPCCCGVTGGLRTFGPGRALGHVSNYVSEQDEALCTNCGLCATRCPTKARSKKKDEETVKFDSTRCYGCGLCVDTCPSKALKLRRLPEEKLNYPTSDSYTELLEQLAADRKTTHLI